MVSFKTNYTPIIDAIIIVLIIVDTILLLLITFYDIDPQTVLYVIYFDLTVCFVLFIEFIYRISNVDEKRKYIITHWYDIVAKNISPDTLTEDEDEKCHVAPEFGYRFRKQPGGFIPRVTNQILKDRIRIKALMKETIDPVERQILNFRQQALKTFISTIYGLFNHSTYRWYSIEASEAITAWGREFLKNTMKDAEKHGFKVLYADTDGFYATLENE